jgi:hypothetical protein
VHLEIFPFVFHDIGVWLFFDKTHSFLVERITNFYFFMIESLATME